MRMERVRSTDWVAGAAGLALLVALFLPWWKYAEGGQSAFQVLAVVDLWLALTALTAMAVPAVTAARDAVPVPLAVAVVGEGLSAIAVLLALWRAIDQPSGPLDPTVMPWVGLLLTIAVLVALWRSLRDESAPAVRPAPEPQPMPVPPPDAPAEPSAEPT